MNGDVARKNQDSLREMVGLRDTISGLFDDFFSGRPALTRHLQADSGLGWIPAVDVRETEDAVIVYAALPGVEKEDVQIEVKDSTMVLTGRRKDSGGDEDSWLRRELPTGQFYRAFSLPSEVKSNQVKATFKNGVIEIHMPKAEEAKPHKVQIT